MTAGVVGADVVTAGVVGAGVVVTEVVTAGVVGAGVVIADVVTAGGVGAGVVIADVVAATLVGASVVAAALVGTSVVAAAVVGIPVVAAAVVGASVVAAAVVGMVSGTIQDKPRVVVGDAVVAGSGVMMPKPESAPVSGKISTVPQFRLRAFAARRYKLRQSGVSEASNWSGAQG